MCVYCSYCLWLFFFLLYVINFSAKPNTTPLAMLCIFFAHLHSFQAIVFYDACLFTEVMQSVGAITPPSS